MPSYQEFIKKKSINVKYHGFKPVYRNDQLYDFQNDLVEWSLKKGRAAIFADCGLGKTPMQLVWSENISRKTNGNVLILTPLAVSYQTIREAQKFGIDCERSGDGKFTKNICVSNYERLKYFNPKDFQGIVLDESSILKSFNGKIRGHVTHFMKQIPYRLLCTATAAPNDYIELGTSSESLGELGFMDMLNRFFKNDQNNSAMSRLYGKKIQWRLKGHAETDFWKWICSWAKAIRKPSDIGYDDDGFILPELKENQHVVKATTLPDGFLFELPAIGLKDQREERKRTINDRCERVLDLVSNNSSFSIVWCNLNAEGDLLEDLLPNCQQVSGSDSDDSKESKLYSFVNGEYQNLIIKPKIGAWGLNLQHCSHVVFFPTYSYEQYYQAVRRCWRYGQERPVNVDIVLTNGEEMIMKGLRYKSNKASEMFTNLIKEMNGALEIENKFNANQEERIPKWLS